MSGKWEYALRAPINNINTIGVYKSTGKYCAGCKYWSDETDTCDYILINKKRRGCKPGKDCTKKVAAD